MACGSEGYSLCVSEHSSDANADPANIIVEENTSGSLSTSPELSHLYFQAFSSGETQAYMYEERNKLTKNTPVRKMCTKASDH